ncbi:MAG TPA: 5-formyltetrahydrofolate cyclo-ligase [Paenirhodobacter sp.]
MKDALRKVAFAARRVAHRAQDGASQDVAAANAHLARLLQGFGAAPLAGYMPIRTEIDPVPAMSGYSGPVAVPVIVAAGAPLVFHLWQPDMDMQPGPFGAKVPQVAQEITPQVLIVPLVAFDRHGYRLGYGGGFYDRTLQQLRRMGPVTAIGFAYAAQQVSQVPIEPTDQPLDLIVTENGLITPLTAP